MHVNADHLEPRQARSTGIDFARAADRHAELVLLAACADLLMRPGVNIRVHPQGDRRAHTHRLRHLGQRLHLGIGFHVELPNAALQRRAHFVAGLAHAGKHDARARHARRPGAQVFADRNHVHPGPQIAQQLEHRQIGVGFDRVAE